MSVSTNHRALGKLTLPVIDARDFGVIGDNSTDCTTYLQNAVAAAEAAGSQRVVLPAGDIVVNDTIELGNSGYNGSLGYQGLVISGQSFGATRIRMNTAGAPVFQKVGGVGHSLEDLMIYGPGTGNSASIGVYWENSAGGAAWKNVWIENFGTGARFLDATLMSFFGCCFRANARNVELGYNCDIFNFSGCRLDNASDVSAYLGWRDAGHSAGALQINNIKFDNCRFGANTYAFDVADYGASNIVALNSYFEDNDYIGIYGDAAQTTGPKEIQFLNNFFTVLSANTQFQTRHANQESSFIIDSNRSDGNATWMSLGLNCRLVWNENDLLTGTNHLTWNGGTYTFNKWNSYRVNFTEQQIQDGSVLSTNIPVDIRMTNGTGKTWARFSRRNAATGAELGIAQSEVIDINGQMVCFHGPHKFVTPSSSLPTASSTYRGIAVYQQGGAGVADTIVCCMKDSADAYSWKTIATG